MGLASPEALQLISYSVGLPTRMIDHSTVSLCSWIGYGLMQLSMGGLTPFAEWLLASRSISAKPLHHMRPVDLCITRQTVFMNQKL